MPASLGPGTSRCCRSAATGCCSLPESVHSYAGVSHVAGRCSPGLLLFREFLLPVVRRLFRGAPLMRFPKSPLAGIVRAPESPPPCGFSASFLRTVSSPSCALSSRSCVSGGRSTRPLDPLASLLRKKPGSLGASVVALSSSLLLADSVPLQSARAVSASECSSPRRVELSFAEPAFSPSNFLPLPRGFSRTLSGPP